MPHPVNDAVAQLADALVAARAAGDDAVPEPVVVAPMSGSYARRTTRRALRALSAGADPDEVFALGGDIDLAAAAPGIKRPTEASHAWPIIALPGSVGTTSVSQRAALRVLLEHGDFDLVHLHDPLADETTRFLAKHWNGLAVGTFHTAPPSTVLAALASPSRERVVDSVDRWFVGDDTQRRVFVEHLGDELDPIVVADSAAAHVEAYDALRERIQVHIPAPTARDDRSCVIDLHMHTSHSWDCATDPAALLHVAREVGLTAVAVTDHNEISGALACAELADEYGIQVIVGEEVKTSQGEVIGLFLTERIEPGMTWHETIAAIRAQDGLVYVPHPFDRLHTIPDVHLLRDTIDEIDAFETYNARLPFDQYNRDAERFARKYNLVEGAGSDAHVVQGLGTAAVHMPAWDDKESFLVALAQGEILKRPKSLLYLQGLKWVNDLTGRSKKLPAEAHGRD